MILRSLRIKRLLILALLSFTIVYVLLNLVLPYDSPIVLAFRFNVAGLKLWFRGSGIQKDAWLFKPETHPFEFHTDVGLLIKTGYGTRHRLEAQLEALDLRADDTDVFVVVGDWTPREDGRVAGVQVHDAVGGVMATPTMQSHLDAPKFKKYLALREAVQAGDDTKATGIGKDFGWELDALKFIWGLEYVYENLSPKKWYIILDDDTYLVKSSLRLLLSHWDPDLPYYVGNAVGDFKGRFAHGGSAVVISHEAARRLLSRRDVIDVAYERSLEETWGDKLVAMAFQKIGVYLDERYSHFFNGERPGISKIMADRFCSPLVSFHGVTDPAEMRKIGAAFRDERRPVLWRQLWDMYGGTSVEEFKRLPIQPGQDHVGRPDEHVTVMRSVESAEKCLEACQGLLARCLAWTWVQQSMECRLSPWMIVGEPALGHHYSGIHVEKVRKLLELC